MMRNTTNELYHHGIKGQKWGIRRYQNPDGTLTAEGKARYLNGGDYTIGKGSLFYRTAFRNPNGYNSSLGRVYVSTNPKDNQVWEDLYKRSYNREGDKLYSVQMKAVKDIKVAGGNTVAEKWVDKMMSDKSFANQTINDLLYSKSHYGLNVLNSKDGSFNYLDFSKTLGYSTESAKSFFNEMKNLGYDAIADVYGSSSEDVDEPLIILDPDNKIRKTKISQIQ